MLEIDIDLNLHRMAAYLEAYDDYLRAEQASRTGERAGP
jgi:hypothetical protein